VKTLTSLVLTAVFGVTTLTACGQSEARTATSTGGDATRAATATATDPCTLLGTDQLAEALGSTPSRQGAATEQARGLTCSWTFADPGSAVGDGTLAITTWHGREFFAAGTIGDPVPGLADGAQADTSSGGVLFRSGDDVVQVQVLSPRRKDRAVAVARAAASAL